MTQLTTLDELKHNIGVLAAVEETGSPFVSCYLNIENGESDWRDLFDKRVNILRRAHKHVALADLEDSLAQIESWLAANLLPEAKGVAVFARHSADGGFLLPMQFAVPLPNLIAVYPTPNIFHLIELKDNYHRYVVMIATADWARILEVNLGAATIKAWINEPDLRLRVGSEWSRPQYQINQANRGDRFVAEKVGVLKRLMRSGGHTHLLLAGDPEMTARVSEALPGDLLNKLVDVIPSSACDEHDDVVMATLSSFISHEEQESRTIAERLIEGLRSQNLAVAGSAATLDALRWGEVDTLVMASDYAPDPGWTCTSCKAMGTEAPTTSTCQRCGEDTARPLDVKEALLRLAEQFEYPVEVVEEFDMLLALGGVGCLLRSRFDVRTGHAVAAARE